MALAASPARAESTTAIATENEDAVWEQIEKLEAKSDAIFKKNAALWEKVDEACNALPEDYDFKDFDEAEFIRSTTALTETEKTAILADIKELDGLDAKMEALYAKLPACDDMPLYEKALEKADPKVLDLSLIHIYVGRRHRNDHKEAEGDMRSGTEGRAVRNRAVYRAVLF